MTTSDLLRLRLLRQVLALEREDRQVRSGEARAVHQVGFATRRLRSALATFEPVLEEGPTQSLREDLRWLGLTLGAARDAELLHARLSGTCPPLTGMAHRLTSGPWALVTASPEGETADMASPHQSRLSGQVVAGLTDNAVSASVVIVAVAEARRRQARITFIHVVPEGQNRDDHADAAAAMFRTVLRATGAGDIPYTFETMTGDAAATLVESCQDADLLVLGADDLTATARVADYCLEHCVCPVRVVTERNDSPAEERASVILSSVVLSPDDLKADRGSARAVTGRGGTEVSMSRSVRTT